MDTFGEKAVLALKGRHGAAILEDATYFWDPGSFVAQALQNGQNGYNGGKKVFVSCNF